jgi:hypothetical protein
MVLMFDVKPTCIYRHLYQRYTLQCAIANRGNVTIKVVMRKKKKLSELSRIPN